MYYVLFDLLRSLYHILYPQLFNLNWEDTKGYIEDAHGKASVWDYWLRVDLQYAIESNDYSILRKSTSLGAGISGCQ